VGIFVGEGVVGVETSGGLVTALVGLKVGGDGGNGGDGNGDAGDGGDGDGVVFSPLPPAGVGAAAAVVGVVVGVSFSGLVTALVGLRVGGDGGNGGAGDGGDGDGVVLSSPPPAGVGAVAVVVGVVVGVLLGG
jgi:hypothetical protein